MPVAAVDGVLIAHGAAGVCDSLDARLTSLLDGITPCEGKERIGREHRHLASSPAFSGAILTELTLFGCPEPMPRSLPWVATVMALDLTCLTTLHANLSASYCSWVGCVSVTTSKWISSGTRLWTLGKPPPTWRRVDEGSWGLASRMRRFLDLPLSTSRPFSVYEGAR